MTAIVEIEEDEDERNRDQDAACEARAKQTRRVSAALHADSVTWIRANNTLFAVNDAQHTGNGRNETPMWEMKRFDALYDRGWPDSVLVALFVS